MELHVLYDDLGNILASVRLDDESSPNATLGGRPIPGPRPVPEPGQYTADVKVPDDFAHLSFLEVCNQLVVEGGVEVAGIRPVCLPCRLAKNAPRIP
jgi:hypothetical protein